MKKRVAIIPARGGSKRIPYKNLRLLAGKPLIGYSIAAARESGLFERVVVSTDDPKIAEVAQQCGAEVPFARSSELADDVTPVSAVTWDALRRLDPDGSKYDGVAQLMANCPLRTARDIVESHEQFARGSARSQISVTRYGWQNPWWALRRADDLKLEPLFPDQQRQRSQDLPELFCPTGAVWWAASEVLLRERTFHIQGRTGWEIAWQRAVDIDTEDDLTMAEVLLQLARGGHATS